MTTSPNHQILWDLRFFTSKCGFVYKSGEGGYCPRRLRAWRQTGTSIVRLIEDKLRSFAKSRRHKSLDGVAVSLAVLSVAVIAERTSRDSALQLLEDVSVLSQWMEYRYIKMMDGWYPPNFAVMIVAIISAILLAPWCTHGGSAWGFAKLSAALKLRSLQTPQGPKGWPLLGSWKLMQGASMHRNLAYHAWNGGVSTRSLMAVSVGTSRIVLTSDPKVAKEILRSAVFAERPMKQSAVELTFARAMGFACQGPYWRHLRQIAATRLFSHTQISANYESLQTETSRMLLSMASHASSDHSSTHHDVLCLRPFLQRAAVNNMMSIVFGKHYEFATACPEAESVEAMIREGFELLGAFNWADHLPLLRHIPYLSFFKRCRKLTSRVQAFVQPLLDEHRRHQQQSVNSESSTPQRRTFVDVLLALQDDHRLSDEDMISVLWEMLFRGTDTIAVLTEWALAEIVLNPNVQSRLHKELDRVVGSNRTVEHEDINHLQYLQAVVKETLRCHPPGPLLSWARLAIEDTHVAGFNIPRGTTAMVNMWAITHDPSVWPDPQVFNPTRFLESEGGVEFDVRGNDLRLAPFGSGRRVCPGRSLGLETTHLWLARLLHHFSWSQAPNLPINLEDNLKLSCEMASPLHSCPTFRVPLQIIK